MFVIGSLQHGAPSRTYYCLRVLYQSSLLYATSFNVETFPHNTTQYKKPTCQSVIIHKFHAKLSVSRNTAVDILHLPNRTDSRFTGRNVAQSIISHCSSSLRRQPKNAHRPSSRIVPAAG